jgi:hypothetical protein
VRQRGDLATKAWLRARRTVALWATVVSLVYMGGTVAMATGLGRVGAPEPVRDLAHAAVPIQVASGILHGDPSLASAPGGVDTVTRDGRSYHVISLGPVLPYLVVVPLPDTWTWARWLVPLAFGLGAALLAWPLASRYGPGGPATIWLATLGALGTLLLPLSIRGDFFYLAHGEAMAMTILALLEWRGRRRPWVIGLTLGLASLARPTVILAAVPFAVFVISASRTRIRAAVSFAIPIGLVLLAMGTFNAARFGSPLETGYGLAILKNSTLRLARSEGAFALVHVPDNLRVLVAGGFRLRRHLPFLIPSPYGQSILLTTPALVLAVRAGFHDRTAQLLWLSTAAVAAALLLYYGGAGFSTYGYRYSLDVTPFLLALVAMAAGQGFGRLSKILIVLSVVLCFYGIVTYKWW